MRDVMPFDEIEFAVKRSNNAAIAANENSRPMSQYALLINGAAGVQLLRFFQRIKLTRLFSLRRHGPSVLTRSASCLAR